jgi:hypothetical protein
MPTNDIHSHRCRSEQISRAVLSLVVPRRSICSPTTFPTNPAASALDGMGVAGASLTCERGLPTGSGPGRWSHKRLSPLEWMLLLLSRGVWACVAGDVCP